MSVNHVDCSEIRKIEKKITYEIFFEPLTADDDKYCLSTKRCRFKSQKRYIKIIYVGIYESSI
jgi:hypothetical protein